MYITEPALPGQEPNKGGENRTVEGGAWNATHMRQTGGANKKVNQRRNEATVADQPERLIKTIKSQTRVTQRVSSLKSACVLLASPRKDSTETNKSLPKQGGDRSSVWFKERQTVEVYVGDC